MANIEYVENRKWSDATLPQGILIIANALRLDLTDGSCSIAETSVYEDTKLSADLKLKIGDLDIMIGYRSRKKMFIAQYPFDVTIRSVNKAGYKTEFAKIMDGCGDINLYTFTDSGNIVRWILINLEGFRKIHTYDTAQQRWVPNENIKVGSRSNKSVYDTDFLAYDMLTIHRNDLLLEKHNRVILSHSPGYFDDIKVSILPPSGNKTVEMYSLKRQEERIDAY